MPSQDVCLSVPSVTRRDSVETVIHILNLFIHRQVATPLVLAYQTVWQQSDGDSPNGGVKCNGVYEQEAQLSQRDRARIRVIEYFAKSLKITQGHLK